MHHITVTISKITEPTEPSTTKDRNSEREEDRITINFIIPINQWNQAK